MVFQDTDFSHRIGINLVHSQIEVLDLSMTMLLNRMYQNTIFYF